MVALVRVRTPKQLNAAVSPLQGGTVLWRKYILQWFTTQIDGESHTDPIYIMYTIYGICAIQ